MPSPAEPSSLIARAKQGDVRAFEQLIAEHVPRVRRFARSMCADAAEADDLAQDALLKAYQSLGSYGFQSAFSTWLFRIVRNAFIDNRRSAHAKRRAHTDVLEGDGIADETSDTPDTGLLRDELRAQLWDALRALPIEYRSTVLLFDVEGLSQEEVAAIEGVAVGTVKSRLSRGRAQLREALVQAGVDLGGNVQRPALVEPRRTTP